MNKSCIAFQYHGSVDAPKGDLLKLSTDQLSPGNVLIRNEFASVNYKDALASRGINRIIRELPRIGGIDLAGRVEHSDDPRFTTGQAVVVHGFGIGVDHDGGYAQFARVPAQWVLPLPEQISTRQACAIGVAGYTAALSIHTMEQLGLAPSDGSVIVTGATGGSGSVAANILAARGYQVAALTRKPEQAQLLHQIGVSEIIGPDAISDGKRPLEQRRWAGAVDAVGGTTLAWLLRTMQDNGIVTAFGNAAGAKLNTTVLPFILRGVRLVGINANSAMPLRSQVWQRIATDLMPPMLDHLTTEITLEQLPEAFDRLLAGGGLGRTVVRL